MSNVSILARNFVKIVSFDTFPKNVEKSPLLILIHDVYSHKPRVLRICMSCLYLISDICLFPLPRDTAAQSEVNTANLRIQVEARLSELSRALLDLNSKVESSIQKQNLLEQTVIDR